jgi:Rieske Fe-S protein
MPKHTVSRRDFVSLVTAFVGSAIGALVGLPAIAYLISPALQEQISEDWIPLGPLENYPEGIPTLFSFVRVKENGWEKTSNSYGVYVIRKGENVTVFSNVCTHLSCRVTWKDNMGIFLCPCHDGHFDIQGKVTAGPPPRPLDAYQTKLEDGNLFIYFKEA